MRWNQLNSVIGCCKRLEYSKALTRLPRECLSVSSGRNLLFRFHFKKCTTARHIYSKRMLNQYKMSDADI